MEGQSLNNSQLVARFSLCVICSPLQCQTDSASTSVLSADAPLPSGFPSFLSAIYPTLSAQLEANLSSRAFDEYHLLLGSGSGGSGFGGAGGAGGQEADRDHVEQLVQLCYTQVVQELNAAAGDDQSEAQFSQQQQRGKKGYSQQQRTRGALPSPAQESGGAGVLGISWSCNGSVLAAGYGRTDHVGWCVHSGSACIAFWNLMRRQLDPSQPDMVLETDFCPTALAYHPERATIVAAGLFNGEIRVWDTALIDQEGGGGEGGDAAAAAGGVDAGNPLLMRSGIDDYFHREPITRLQWVRDPSALARGGGAGAGVGGIGGGWSLVSVAGDGKVLFWSVDGDNRLRFPTGGFMLTPNAEWHGKGQTRKGFGIMGGTAVAFVDSATADASAAAPGAAAAGGGAATGASHYFVAATEGGGVVRVALPLLRPKGGGTTDAATGLRWHRDAHRLVENADPASRFDLRKLIEKAARGSAAGSGNEVTLETIFSVARPPPSMLYPSAVNRAFEGHAGPAYGLEFNKFDKRIFASAATDGKVKLFHVNQPKPLLTLEALGGGGVSGARAGAGAGGQIGSTTYLYSLAWSPARPLLLAVGTSDGRVLLYDLQQSMLAPALSLSVSADRAAAVQSLQFNRLEPGLLAAADTKGRVVVFDLAASSAASAGRADRFATIQPGEKRLIQQMGALSANV